MNVLEARRRLLGAGVYKKTVTGNPAIAQGSLARMYPGIEMQGWTEQAQYEGNQLFDASKISTKSAGGANVTNNGDGSFTISGEGKLSGTYSNRIIIPYESFFEIKEGPLSLLCDRTNPYFFFQLLNENNEIIANITSGNNTAEITQDIAQSIKKVIMGFYGPVGEDIEPGTIKPMVYQNGGGTWEPYTGGAPSPSPEYPQEIVSAGNYDEASGKYKVDVQLTGAQLLDKDTFFAESPTEEFIKYYPMSVYNGKYTLSSDVPIENNAANLFLLSGNVTSGASNNGNGVGAQHPHTVEVTDGYITIAIRALRDSNLNNPLDYNIMLNAGETPLPWEPYKPPQTVTLTSDRPLTKWDKLTKKDGQWGWEYKSKQIILNGTILNIIGNGTWGNIDDYKTIAFYSYINGLNNSQDIGADMSRAEEALTNQFIYGHVYNSADVNKFMISSSGEYIAFRVDADMLPDWSSEAPSNQPFIDWLDEKEQAGKPVTLLYPTIEETFVPLSASEQEQMNALHTNRPTTVLSNDADCEMTLTYKTKKSLWGGV